MNQFSTVPHLIITIDGSEISSELIQTIQMIRVKQLLSTPSQCEITLPEAHQQISSEVLSKIGSFLQIKTEQHDKPLFYGQITAVDCVYDNALKPMISIRAYDLLHQLRKRQPVRSHSQVNLFQLAQELTQNMEITVHGGEETPTLPLIFQYQQSDLQLLHETGESYGHYFFLDATNLRIASVEGRPTKQPLTLGENLFEARFSINAETVTESVTATGWNMQRTTAHSMTAEHSDITTNSPFNAADFASDGHRTLVDHPIQDDNQSEAIAQKELDRQIAQQRTFWGVADGNPDLTPGSAIQIAGVATALEGHYVITEVTHTIDSSKGYISEINTVPPRIEKTRHNKNATIAVVSQVNDPDNLARIKVTLPSYNNIETDWLEVLTPGAGANKGLFILPDTGDTVLLLMLNGEPAQSIILGGLLGEQTLPLSVVEDGAVKRFITQTAENQRIVLDDVETSILMETQTGHNINLNPEQISITHNNGSFISLANNNMTLHSETHLTIEAPGSSITIRGKKINFEEA